MLLLGTGSGIMTHGCVCVVFVSLIPVMLLPAYCTSTSRHPCQWYKSCYVCVQVMYLLDLLFSLKNKYQYTYLNTYILPPACPTFYVLYGMTKKGCVLVGLPVKGVISGSVGK